MTIVIHHGRSNWGNAICNIVGDLVFIDEPLFAAVILSTNIIHA